MEPFRVLKSKAMVFLVPDIDTDVITPMRRIVSNMDALEKYAFEDYRYIGGDADKGSPNPDFPLNMEKYAGAGIMIVGENFGCGSSRETAAEAIRRCGIRCLIGKSFSTIFTKNCFQQGILPVVLAPPLIEQLACIAEEGKVLEVNLEKNLIRTDSAEIPFRINEFRRKGLLSGLDDVETTLLMKDRILAFRHADHFRRPWLYMPPV